MSLPVIWIANFIGLWFFVLFETAPLLLLLRGLGQLRQQVGCPTPGSGIAVGQPAPSSTVYDSQGKSIRIEDIKRKRMLLFILIECPACDQAIQDIVQLHQQNQQLVPLIIGREDVKANQEYAQKHNLSLPILRPDIDQPENIYDFGLFPFAFIPDEKGIIRAKGVVTRTEPLSALIAKAFPLLSVNSEKLAL